MEELDLKELFLMFWNKKFQIIAIVLFFAIIGGVYSMLYVKPKYKSSTTLVLAKSADESGDIKNSITQTDITLNQKLISTYSELIKSKAVVRQVLDNLTFSDVSEDYLRKNITVSSVKDTELIQITVAHENSERAAAMANEIAKVFTDKVLEIYNISNVHIVDAAETTSVAYNINHTKDVAIFVAIGIVVAAAYVLIFNLFDTTIKTETDIERVTGLQVLATLPEYDLNAKVKGGTI